MVILRSTWLPRTSYAPSHPTRNSLKVSPLLFLPPLFNPLPNDMLQLSELDQVNPQVGSVGMMSLSLHCITQLSSPPQCSNGDTRTGLARFHCRTNPTDYDLKYDGGVRREGKQQDLDKSWTGYLAFYTSVWLNWSLIFVQQLYILTWKLGALYLTEHIISSIMYKKKMMMTMIRSASDNLMAGFFNWLPQSWCVSGSWRHARLWV